MIKNIFAKKDKAITGHFKRATKEDDVGKPFMPELHKVKIEPKILDVMDLKQGQDLFL